VTLKLLFVSLSVMIRCALPIPFFQVAFSLVILILLVPLFFFCDRTEDFPPCGGRCRTCPPSFPPPGLFLLFFPAGNRDTSPPPLPPPRKTGRKFPFPALTPFRKLFLSPLHVFWGVYPSRPPPLLAEVWGRRDFSRLQYGAASGSHASLSIRVHTRFLSAPESARRSFLFSGRVSWRVLPRLFSLFFFSPLRDMELYLVVESSRQELSLTRPPPLPARTDFLSHETCRPFFSISAYVDAVLSSSFLRSLYPLRIMGKQFSFLT